MKDKCYIVTSGSYSDYRINAVFTDLDEANEYINAMPHSDEADMETWIMDEPREDWFETHVTFNVDGNVVNVYTTEQCSYKRRRTIGTRKNGTELWVIVYTYERDRAIKVAAEKRREYLASLWTITPVV
jgi:hypothetical protein